MVLCFFQRVLEPLASEVSQASSKAAAEVVVASIAQRPTVNVESESRTEGHPVARVTRVRRGFSVGRQGLLESPSSGMRSTAKVVPARLVGTKYYLARCVSWYMCQVVAELEWWSTQGRVRV